MLDKQKVELMTKLAFYEQAHGKDDFKMNEYYRKDYTGFHTLCSVIWVTIGYVCVIGLLALASLDQILANISKNMLITAGIAVVLGYLVVVILYTIIASRLYDKRHREARQRIKRFNHDLTRLLKMYEKEKK